MSFHGRKKSRVGNDDGSEGMQVLEGCKNHLEPLFVAFMSEAFLFATLMWNPVSGESLNFRCGTLASCRAFIWNY